MTSDEMRSEIERLRIALHLADNECRSAWSILRGSDPSTAEQGCLALQERLQAACETRDSLFPVVAAARSVTLAWRRSLAGTINLGFVRDLSALLDALSAAVRDLEQAERAARSEGAPS